MAQDENLAAIRASLALKRAHADEQDTAAIASPSVIADKLLYSKPVQLALQHPIAAGVAVGILSLIGPARLLRVALAGLGLVQTALSVRAAYLEGRSAAEKWTS